MFGFMWALTILTFASRAICLVGVRRPAIGLLGIGMLSHLAPVSTHFLSRRTLGWNTVSYLLMVVQSIFVRLLSTLKMTHHAHARGFVAL